jgi:hypothetical protein
MSFFRFDSNLLDSSGRGKNLSGGITYTTGFRGQALAIGTATRADAFGLSAVPASIAFWVFPDSQDQGLTGWTDGAGTVLFGFDISGEAFSVVGDGSIAFSIGLSELDWHHLILTHDSATARLYLNGSLVWSGSLPITTPFTDFEVSSVGVLPNATDDLGIWSRPLLDPEVSALYNAGAGKDPTT